jgi:hypothetical protein
MLATCLPPFGIPGYPLLLICKYPVVCILVLFISGCSSRNDIIPHSDVDVLDGVYEASSWMFQRSRLDIQVYKDGAVQIVHEGKAIYKEGAEDRLLLLPLVLLKELPGYFRANSVNGEKSIELQAYKVTGGFWYIAAVIQLEPPEVESPNASVRERISELQAKPTALQLQLLMVSPTFSAGLPFLVPVGQGRSPVDTSVTLPKEMRFRSLDIDSRGQLPTGATKLATMPSSLTGGEVRAVAQLTPDKAVTWDFSRITFSPSVNVSGRFFKVSILLICIMVLLGMPVLAIFLRTHYAQVNRNRLMRKLAGAEASLRDTLTPEEINSIKKRWLNMDSGELRKQEFK